MGITRVAPLVGAWIEMLGACKAIAKKLSLLLWERGLKYFLCCPLSLLPGVAPLVGAWIEISNKSRSCGWHGVAPLVGAWD